MTSYRDSAGASSFRSADPGQASGIIGQGRIRAKTTAQNPAARHHPLQVPFLAETTSRSSPPDIEERDRNNNTNNNLFFQLTTTFTAGL